MSVKLAQLTQTVLPILRGLSCFNDPDLRGDITTNIFREMTGGVPKPSNRVQVIEVSELTADLIFKDANAETFSLNLNFDRESVGLACHELHRPGQFSEARPRIPVNSGKTAGFVVYTYRSNPIAAFLMYGSNLNNWAGRIGLRQSMHRRTAHPSSHFVRREWAEESGLLWISPVAKQGGKII